MFDSGLQPERTALAWRRTSLTIATCALVALRVLPQAAETWWSPIPGLFGFCSAVFLFVVSHCRYTELNRHLSAAQDVYIINAAMILLAVVTTGLLGLLSLTALLLRLVQA